MPIGWHFRYVTAYRSCSRKRPANSSPAHEASLPPLAQLPTPDKPDFARRPTGATGRAE